MTGKTSKPRFSVKDVDPKSVKHIALRYINDYENYSMADLGRYYNYTDSQIESIIHRAIKENLVTYKEANAICRKSSSNQRRHLKAGYTGKTPADHFYKALFAARYDYIRKNYDLSIAPGIAKNFIVPGVTLDAVANSLGLSKTEAFWIIKKGAVIHFNDQEWHLFLNALHEKTTNPEECDIIIHRMTEVRNAYMAKLAELDSVRNQLEHYAGMITASEMKRKDQIIETLEGYDEFASADEDDQKNKEYLEHELASFEGKFVGTKEDFKSEKALSKKFILLTKEVAALEESREEI